MKTVVIYTWARDVQNAAVTADAAIDWRSDKMVPGEDDSAAITTAVALTGPADAVVGLTIGTGDASWALARGVPQAVAVTDAPFTFDNAVTAQILAAAVRHIGDVDAVVIGDATEFPGVAPTLAGLLAVPCITQVHSAGRPAGGGVSVRREVGDTVEELHVETPVVLGVGAVGADTRKPGMKEQLAARRRPVTAVTLADLGLSPGQTLTQTITLSASRLPASTQAHVYTGDDAVADLVSALRGEGVLS